MSLLANSNAIETGGYQISRSVRLRSSASAYFNRTPASATNRQTWTWSGWIKRGVLGSQCDLFCGDSSTTISEINIGSDDTLKFWQSGTTLARQSTAVFRDPSAWYHIVVVLDTTNATAQNRCRMYVNGVEITTWTTNNTITQNAQFGINTATAHNLGRSTAANIYFDGYLTEINFIDGQALTPSSFGETNSITGVWQPKKYAGTYGTNGFYLNFSDNSNNTATTIGKDYSGNGNNWTPNNINVSAYTGTPPNNTSYDSMLDVPSGSGYADGGNGRGNYATLNPLDKNAGTTPSNANLTWTASTPWRPARATFGMTTGKWYWEVTASGANCMVGIGTATAAIGDNNYPGKDANGWGYFDSNGNKFNNGSGSAYGASYTTNDVIGVAFDADSGTLTFYKNNASQGTAFTGLTSGPYFPMIGNEGSTSYHNFGQRPFSYTPPTGFKALNTTNLSDPTVKNGAGYFAATLYTGNNTSQSISNAVNGTSFQPDFVWIKNRSGAISHSLYDSVRGAGWRLASNETTAQLNYTSQMTAFNSNGFSVATTNNEVNESPTSYVGWQWKANGTGVSNTAGTITSTVSANTTSGFSIVTYTGQEPTPGTIGHGLGTAPFMIITKNRSGTGNWAVYHKFMDASSPQAYYAQLNSTSARINATDIWNNTAPTSTVFSVGNAGTTNASGSSFVAYCFAPINSYSAFGSYTGNGSTDGPFVFCGFRPRFILVKSSSGAFDWHITDTSRSTYNQADTVLFPNSSAAETNGGGYYYDLLSNGFKCRNLGSATNGSGATYIYAAFAENPLKFSNAR